jgi:hypothetical protein
VDGVTEAKQIFGEIGAVLPGDAGKERNAPLRILNRHAHSNNAAKQPKNPASGRSLPAQAIAFDSREV